MSRLRVLAGEVHGHAPGDEFDFDGPAYQEQALIDSGAVEAVGERTVVEEPVLVAPRQQPDPIPVEPDDESGFDDATEPDPGDIDLPDLGDDNQKEQ